MTFFDTYSEQSSIKDIKASQKALFFLANLIIIFIINKTYLSIFCIITIFILILSLNKITPLKLLKLLIIPCIFLLMAGLPIVFQIQANQALFSFNFLNIQLGISQKSINYTTLILTKSLAILLCSYFLILNSSMNTLLNLLYKLKVPILLVNMFELTYRFIYIILFQTQKINNAQQARLGYISYRKSLISFALMFKNTFIKSFERINNLQITLDSRLYNDEINYYRSKEKFSHKFLYFSIIYCSILLVMGLIL